MYLADSINRATDVTTRRSLRSSSSTAVVVPVTRCSTIGDRAFPVAAARAWNSLPSFITSSSSLLTFKRISSEYHISDADSNCLLVFCLPNMLTIVIMLRVFVVYFELNPTLNFSFIIMIIIIIITFTVNKFIKAIFKLNRPPIMAKMVLG